MAGRTGIRISESGRESLEGGRAPARWTSTGALPGAVSQAAPVAVAARARELRPTPPHARLCPDVQTAATEQAVAAFLRYLAVANAEGELDEASRREVEAAVVGLVRAGGAGFGGNGGENIRT